MSLTEDEEFELLNLERERAMAGGYKPKTAPSQKGLAGKAWDALAIPEKLSREGLSQLAEMVPTAKMTGNLAKDFALNAPKVVAETIAETAPDFISPESIATAGALKAGKVAAPAIKAVGRGIGKAAEGLSGLEYRTPGVLAEAAKDPSLFFAKGKKAASELYETAKNETGKSNLFKGMYKPDQIIDTAQEYLAKGGVLEPSEALAYRKALDKAMKSGKYLKDELVSLRKEADAIAKQSEAVKMADPIYARGARAEALRLPFAQNKSGGTSIAKGILGVLGGVVPNVAMSPLVQGVTATAAGQLAKIASELGKTPIKSGAVTSSVLMNLVRLLSESER